jgi:hypothetical protein
MAATRLLPATRSTRARRTTIWLWRKRAIGYALAGALLTFLSLLVLAIVGKTVAATVYGQPMAGGTVAVFGVLFAISLGMSIWYTSGLEET